MAALHSNFIRNIKKSNLSPKATSSTLPFKSTDFLSYIKIIGVACHYIQLHIKNYNFV